MSNRTKKSNRSTVKFGDFAENVAVRIDPAEAKTDIYVGLEHLDPQSLHLKKWGHPSDVTGQKLVFKKGDVIFGRRRAYQRKLAIAQFDGICSAHAMVVRAKPDMILPEFLPFFLQSDMFMERAIGISVGSLSPTINWRTLKVQEFRIPLIEEQKRIAEILWAADETVAGWESVYEYASAALQSYVDRTFFCPTAGHKALAVGEICTIQCGFAFKSRDYQDAGIPLIRISNVKEPYVDVAERTVFLPDAFVSENPSFVLQKGDLLIALSGATTGKIGIYNSDKKALLNQRVGRLVYKDSSPISKALTTQVFYSFRDRILGDAYGGAQPNISPRDIEKYTIYVPKIGLVATEATVQAMVRSRDSAKDQLLASVHLVAVLRNMLVSEGGPVA